MPKTVVELLACWQGNFGHHRNGVIWMAVPHCLMWCIWRERNNRCFEDSERNIAGLKLFFFITQSDWMSIIGSHSIFSVYDLMDACNLCIWLFWSPAVYLDDSFLCLWIKFSLLIKKKKTRNQLLFTCIRISREDVDKASTNSRTNMKPWAIWTCHTYNWPIANDNFQTESHFLSNHFSLVRMAFHFI